MKVGRFVIFAVLAVAAITSGALLAQAPQAVGTWAPVQDLQTPLSNGASVALPDGRTLIAGGLNADGTLSDTITIYDPVNDSLTPAGVLVTPRSGHTATLLKDGRIVITGGVTDGGLISTDIEVFDPTAGTSMLVAQLAEPRRGHVAASLPDGTVLVAGGATTDGVVLQSAAIFDPETNSVSPLSTSLQTPRVNASATTLLDGQVLIAGGSNGAADLASAEIYDRYSRSFAMAQTQMSIARQGHSAVLLPHNGGVLIVGGTSNAGTDLFLPAVFPDPYSYGEGAFTATGVMAAPRAAALAGPTSIEGFAFAASAGAHDAEVYRFATIKTDKDDYAPGQLAVITGSGWEANEEVTLLFQEDPAVHEDYVLKVQTDSAGNISWNQWAPEGHDFGVRFYLTATGSKSRAQMTFTDGAAETTVGVSCSPVSVPSGSPTTCTTTVTNTATATWPKGSIDWSLTGGLTGSFSAPSCNLTQSNPPNSSSCGVTFTPDGLTLTGKVKGTYKASPADWKDGNDQFTITVTTTKTTPTITFATAPTPTFGGGNFSVSATTTNTDSSALTYSVVSGPCAFISGSTFSSSSAGACVVRASGAATANFNAATNTQSVAIAQGSSSTVVTCTAGPFVYNASAQTPCTVTVTGAGGLSLTPPATYADNIDAGTATASYTFAGDANHTGSSDSKTFSIDKAPSTTVVTIVGGPFSYTGAAHTPATVTVTGAGGLSLTPTATYADNVNAGTATASYSYAGDDNHTGSSDSKTFTIAKAASTTTVTCPVSVTFNGAAQTPCSAKATGAGGLDQVLTVNYSNNTNAGTATASASFGGDANHTGDDDSKTFVISKANAVVTVVAYGGVYDGQPHGASGYVKGVLSESLSGLDLGAKFTDVPGGTAHWIFTDATGNYNNDSGDVAITIERATLKVKADNKSKTYDGTAFTAFTVSFEGFVNNETAGVATQGTPAFSTTPSPAVNPGTYVIVPSTGGLTAANYTFSFVNGTLNIGFGTCSAASGVGNVVLPPINSDGSSVYNRKGGSTIPVKFRVCDAAGRPISDKSVVFGNSTGTIQMLSAVRGTVTSALEDVVNDVPDVAFRWTGQEWIFNMATSNLTSGTTYDFRIVLTTGSIPFRIGIK